MNNLDKQYQALLQDILDNGVKKQDRTGTGTLSLFGRQIRHKMSDGFPLLTTKKLHWKSIVGELLWFLSGDTNIKWLVENGISIWNGDCYKKYKTEVVNNNMWPVLVIDSGKPRPYTQEEFINRIKTDDKFAEYWGDLGPIYGKQWRNWVRGVDYDVDYENGINDEIDQIANAIHLLKTNPDDRGIIVSAWNVGELDNMVLRPCHNFFQLYSFKKEEKHHLSIMVNIRSNDIPLGFPFNIASYGLLLEIISKITNMTPDEIIINIGDAHIYLNQIEGITEQMLREPYPLSSLVISDQVNFNEGIDEFLNSCLITDFIVENYKYHPSIKIPLSN